MNLRELLEEYGPLGLHKQARDGNGNITACLLENAKKALIEKNEREFNLFYQAWGKRLQYWALQKLRQWEDWPLEQIGQTPENLLEDLIQELLIKLTQTASYQNLGYRELEGYLFRVTQNAVIDYIRNLKILPTPGQILKAMISCYQSGYKDELRRAVGIFNNPEQYKFLLEKRRASKHGRTSKIAKKTDFYSIIVHSLNGKAPRQVAELLNRDVRDIYQPKKHAILETWLNICKAVALEKQGALPLAELAGFSALKNCIAAKLETPLGRCGGIELP